MSKQELKFCQTQHYLNSNLDNLQMKNQLLADFDLHPHSIIYNTIYIPQDLQLSPHSTMWSLTNQATNVRECYVCKYIGTYLVSPMMPTLPMIPTIPKILDWHQNVKKWSSIPIFDWTCQLTWLNMSTHWSCGHPFHLGIRYVLLFAKWNQNSCLTPCWFLHWHHVKINHC